MDGRLGKWVVIGLLVVVAFVASACGTLEVERAPATGTAEAAATATREPLPTATEMPSPTPTSEVQDEEIVWDSEIVSLDETWNRYTSNGQGFSIKYPKTMATFRGSCVWNQEQGSYRPEMALVSVKILEDTDAVYIAPEYYYELAGERIEDNIHYYDECNQITNSLELLRDPDRFQEPFWKLAVREIHDDAELNGFLKARYGSGCSLGEKALSGQDGVYDVKILGDGKSMEETECLLNFGTVVKYYPVGNKVIAWDTGQAATFPADVNYSVIHDQEMVDSFSFFDAAATTPAAPGEEEIVWASEIISLDETWNRYTSNGQGFSIEFPKMMMAFNGSCAWNEEYQTYQWGMALVPVNVFEDRDAVYIAGETFYALAGERTETTADGGTRYFYEECNQMVNSVELLRDPNNFHQQMWRLAVAEIRDEDDLEGFIKSRYGSGCSLGEQEASKQGGVYDVRIQGDGKSLEETQCPLNYGTVVKYYPEGNKVIAWNTGQAYTFPADETNAVTYDQEMVDSFEFITDAAVEDPGSSMPAGATEEIADWWGIIGSTEPGAQFDDYFERQDLGQIIYFGIESRDPAVQAQIEVLRDSGTIVHLYGTLLSNVIDYNGSQILVTRIEIEGIADSESYTSDDFGFSFEYPADWELEVIPRRPLDAGTGSPEWLADAVVLSKGKFAISIQHLRVSESVAWDGGLGGGGSYQEAHKEPVTLIGQAAQKWVWTDEDGIKAIELQAVSEDADLAMQIALYDDSVQWIGDLAAETLPETAIGALNQVLSSLTLTQ